MLDRFLEVLQSTSLVCAQMADRGWLAAGDAACAFDPISSQGILNSLFTRCLPG